MVKYTQTVFQSLNNYPGSWSVGLWCQWTGSGRLVWLLSRSLPVFQIPVLVAWPPTASIMTLRNYMVKDYMQKQWNSAKNQLCSITRTLQLSKINIPMVSLCCLLGKLIKHQFPCDDLDLRIREDLRSSLPPFSLNILLMLSFWISFFQNPPFPQMPPWETDNIMWDPTSFFNWRWESDGLWF